MKGSTATKQQLREHIAEAASALSEAKAELAVTRKRQELLIKMAERKEAAVARFVEDWTRKEMAKIEQALKPKTRNRR
ncbi:MAG: hypothetical protein LJE83_02825 [Gammaproteobacteria bacterium]|jgi:sRNA-binding protein|nr:hypothetical protein [Gammaproteobacteria bacterium]